MNKLIATLLASTFLTPLEGMGKELSIIACFNNFYSIKRNGC